MADNRWQRMLPGQSPAPARVAPRRPQVVIPKAAPARGPFTGRLSDTDARVFAVRGFRDLPVMRVKVDGNANVRQFQEWLLAAMNAKFDVEQSIARNAAAFGGGKS